MDLASGCHELVLLPAADDTRGLEEDETLIFFGLGHTSIATGCRAVGARIYKIKFLCFVLAYVLPKQ